MGGNALNNLGLRDVPIEHQRDEQLGLANYAEVLTDFVIDCDTPITVALQGDWGSGKTSLMNLMKESLDKERYLPVWFNTWQYAQFNMSDTLALSMMSYFIDCLAPSGNSAKAVRALLNVARAVAVGGASVIGHGDTIKTVLTEAEPGTGDTDPSRVLTDLKTRITKIVEENIEQSSIEKIVVFIDDIDRLVPVKAVELLEALKVFLDINGCVYIIACDYSVVVTGLKAKFGVDEGELKGKSFFDKIIQVPFKMPIRRYDVKKYLQDLLSRIGLDLDSQDVVSYQELIENSVGFNPRTMKRMFNSLVLLTILAKKELRNSEFGDEASRSRVLFGVLCMQEHYELLYEYIRRKRITDDLLKSLRDELDTAEAFTELREKMLATGEIDFGRAKAFIGAFFNCVQLEEDGDDGSISSMESKHLQEVLSLSAVVSVGTEEVEQHNVSELVVRLRRDLNQGYATHLNKKRKKIGKFRYSTAYGEVYLDLPPPLNSIAFVVWINGVEDGSAVGYGLWGPSDRVSVVGEHFRNELTSVNEFEIWNESEAWYWKSSSEDDLREALFPVLDELLPRLSEICESVPAE